MSLDRKVSRRRFVQLTAAATGALLYADLSGRLGPQQRTAYAIDPFEAYHEVTADDHQKNFDRLSGQGYRMISLSVYGNPSDARYAAVWVQRTGQEFAAVHNVDADGYQAFFDKQAAAGFQPLIVSATGTMRSGRTFAAVFERHVTTLWTAHHDMSATDFASANTTAAQAHQRLRSVAIYGTADDRRYAAIWHTTEHPYFRWYYHAADPEASYQATFDTESKIRGYRPSYVALSDDHTYCSVFTDDSIGPWVARHNLTADQYQAEFDTQKANGNYPVCVQGGGSGADTHFAAIFAQRDIPIDPAFSERGQSIGALDVPFVGLMQQFMDTNGIRAGQLTIAKDGVVRHAMGHLFAEAGYQQPVPTDCFRLASCSKIFLEAAVQSLYDAGKLTTDAKVYPLLGFSKPADPRSDSITIQQLIDHTGGYDDSATGSNFDPTYNMVKIAKDLGLNRAVTKQDVMQYMYARPLDFAPGSISRDNYKYSNYGYLLAGAVVEKVSGQKFFDYVRDALLKPLGISEVQLSPTDKSAKPANEPLYEDGGIGPNALQPTSPTQAPAPYGGDGQILEVSDANAGIAASATALVKFIHVHSVWWNGPRPTLAAGKWSARKGSMPGTLSYACSRGDGVDWAFIINTRDWPTDWDKTSDDFAASINALLDKTTF